MGNGNRQWGSVEAIQVEGRNRQSYCAMTAAACRACYGRCLMSVDSTIIQQAPLYLNVKDIIESFSWLLFIIHNVRTSDCMCEASYLSISKTAPCLVFLSGGPLQWEFTSCCSSGQQVWPAASWHVPQVAQTGELLQGIRLRRLVWNLCKGKMLQWSIFLPLPLLIQIWLNM